jgi:excinuclease ABC subunit C
MKTVTGQDDFACMAETIRRRYSRLLRESVEAADTGGTGGGDSHKSSDGEDEKRARARKPSSEAGGADSPRLPDLILIDGGKGQLNAAIAELAKLGLERIPAIGLAKEFEEIHRPGQKEPLRLSHESGALKLLQRVRDESHRFANTYNAQLRLKRISESLLDEFPGIGENRKAALLKKFGSIQRLRTATVEQIAAIPGFGQKSAADLKAFLEARSADPVAPAEPVADGKNL